MAERRPDNADRRASRSSVLVCRGCCCGNANKHPDVDHAGQVVDLRAAATSVGARFHVVDCLGPCEQANVVVVRRGGLRHWFGGIGTHETDDLARWIAGEDDELPSSLEATVFGGPTDRAKRRLIPARGPELATLCADLGARGAWTMGVPGAIAEFDPAADATSIDVAPAGEATVVTAVTATGAMRIRIDDRTRAFGFGTDAAPEEPAATVLVRTGAGLPPAQGLTEVGADPDPVVDDGPGAVLFDLGLDRSAARFMVRVADRELMMLLRQVGGAPIEALDTTIWQTMVEVSPTRVVETAIGRIEVTAPIPPPDGESPIGCHTHLLPEILALGLDLPSEMTVPPGWRLGPIHYADHVDDHD